MRFKKGDTLRCVNNTDQEGRLKLGGIYICTGSNTYKNVLLEGHSEGYYPYRFERVVKEDSFDNLYKRLKWGGLV